MIRLSDIIRSSDPGVRNRPLDEVVSDLDEETLLAACADLERFRRRSDNLYERVRALMFLHAIHRYHLPRHLAGRVPRPIPVEGVRALFERRFEHAASIFSRDFDRTRSEAASSALAQVYRELGFQTLRDQVKRSVREAGGNAWMFQVESAAAHPLRAHPDLKGGVTLVEETPVRMDLTHSGWSDIFFLGMDFPEGARVLNASIDLAIAGAAAPRPPIRTSLELIDHPTLRLVSRDLGQEAEIRDLEEVFDYARDYLGLLKAAVIASGLVPPALEGSAESLPELLQRVFGEGRGVRIESCVRGIPKGSRLAVSTNLLASLIALVMRATRQTRDLEGPLREEERRLVCARAILGEWLGGSGGGWQDSGGLWPGFKRIEGAIARPGDVEYGTSRGRLLPEHRVLDETEVSAETRERLQRSLVLFHGGMAQDVGPVLEMVTEKYLLRSEPEWTARRDAARIYDRMLDALRRGDIGLVGQLTHENFEGPIQAIIPWATNHFTECLIERVRRRFGPGFRGFWMLGGMSGGGMGMLFDPEIRDRAAREVLEILRGLKRELEHALPFAMDPVVYQVAINDTGSKARVCRGAGAGEPTEEASAGDERDVATSRTLDEILQELGFDRAAHEEIRQDLLSGRIGLAKNRLPARARVEDARQGDVMVPDEADRDALREGESALRSGTVAVVTLAAGSGSRWTRGAGVVKALHPFCRLAGRHRSFLEVHVAKARRTGRRFDCDPLHVVTTSHLTHQPIERAVSNGTIPRERVRLSPGRSIGLRLVPTERDLRFHWRESEKQLLDEQQQKVLDSLREALVKWAKDRGEASDYTDNLPEQCLHPVGHFYEIPNLLLNGTLHDLLDERPHLQTLFLHNIDTLGADLDPVYLGAHLRSGAALTFEVVPRRIEDRGGGLARVDGRLRLVESLALPSEDDEYRLTHYNSMSTWIDIDGLLAALGLRRGDLGDRPRVKDAVRGLARRLPTYVTIKHVKKRWGRGHEDVYPVAQFEKLWGDMSGLPDVETKYLRVPRMRGQQLKDPAQLDGWLRDGSARYVEDRCDFA